MGDQARLKTHLGQPIIGGESTPTIKVHFIIKGSFFFVLWYDMIMYM